MAEKMTTLRAAGLYTSGNPLLLPEGALSLAEDVTYPSDGEVAPRRGLPDETNAFAVGTSCRALAFFRGRRVAHTGNDLEVSAEGGAWEGVEQFIPHEAPDADTPVRFLPEKALLSTSSVGIRVLEEAVYPYRNRQAGLPQALDVQGLIYESSGVAIPANSAAAYRVVVGLKTPHRTLFSPPSGAIVARNTAAGTVNILLRWKLPSWVTTEHFFQVYRSASVTPSTAQPLDEMQLVYEGNPASADISAGFMQVRDTDSLRNGATLYTSPSQGGIAQANEEPPLSRDMVLFKGHAFYLDTASRHRLQLRLLSVLGTSGLQVGDALQVGHLTYTAAASNDYPNGQFALSTDPDVPVAIRETAQSLVRAISEDTRAGTAEARFYAHYLSGPYDSPGTLIIEADGLGVRGDEVTVQAEGFSVHMTPARSCWEPAVPTPTETKINSMAGNTATCATPHGLSEGDFVNLWQTGGQGTTNNPQGLFRVASTPSTTTALLEFAEAGTWGTGAGLSSYFLAKATLKSDDAARPNGGRFSKPSEYEHVPLAQTFSAGSPAYPVLRGAVVGDTLFLVKEDGLYKVVGDSAANFTVTHHDVSLACVAPGSVAVVNNQLLYLSSQGVVAVSEGGATVVGEPVWEDGMKVLLAQGPNAVWIEASATGYESEGLYLLSLTDATWVCHLKRKYRWSRWTPRFAAGGVNPETGRLTLAAQDENFLLVERKALTDADFYDGATAGTFPVSWVAQYNLEAAGDMGALKYFIEVRPILSEARLTTLRVRFMSDADATLEGFRVAGLNTAGSDEGQVSGVRGPRTVRVPVPRNKRWASSLRVRLESSGARSRCSLLGLEVLFSADGGAPYTGIKP